MMSRSQDETGQKKQKKLLHQSSYPIILVNVRNASPEIEPASSLNGLQTEQVEDRITGKSRSLEDTHVSYDDRYY